MRRERCNRWLPCWSAMYYRPPTSGAISMTFGTHIEPSDDAIALSDRIAITGMGVVSPIGQGVEAFWAGLIDGISGITTIERFATHDFRVRRGGEIKQLSGVLVGDQPLPACRASQFLLYAAAEAMRMARLQGSPTPETRLGVVVGSALGGIAAAEC